MSRRANVVAGMRKLFHVMKDDVVTVTLVNESSTYDPRTQQVSKNDETLEVQALKAVYNEREINGVLIKGDDLKFQFIIDDLGSFTIKADTAIYYDDVQYNVVRVKPHLMNTVVHIQARVS